MRRVHLLGSLFLSLYPVSHGLAQTSITVSKSGSDIVLAISGTPAYSIYRSTTPNFAYTGTTLSEGVAGPTYSDSGAAGTNDRLYFYDVDAAGEFGPGRVAGGSPQPNLSISLLTPSAGKEGDIVVITGSGFSQYYPENLVTFNGRPATVTAAGSGTISTTVPSGATTGMVQLRVGRLLSNTLPFTLSPVGAFSNLSGINTNPATLH